LAAARRERWDIHMEIREVSMFRKMAPEVYRFPSTVSDFGVSWLGKYERKEK
jgi:hypothetical protein